MGSVLVENPATDDVCCEKLSSFLAIWHQIQSTFGLPARHHFTFPLLKKHLPYIAIVDHIPAAGRFRVSLMGTLYTEMVGREMTGQYVDEIPHTDNMLQRCNWVVETGKPYFATRNKLAWAGRDYKFYSTVGCPLFDEDGQVCKILFCASFEAKVMAL